MDADKGQEGIARGQESIARGQEGIAQEGIAKY